MSRALRVAVASGKGGTGKTTLATALAIALAGGATPARTRPESHRADVFETAAWTGTEGEAWTGAWTGPETDEAPPSPIKPRVAGGPQLVTLADCDVEQPNLKLFFKLSDPVTAPVWVPAPTIDLEACTGCGVCAERCKFGALAVVNGKPLWFGGLCHGCGACWLSCEAGAISRGRRRIGITADAATEHGGLQLVWGELKTGEPLAPPLIHATKALAATTGNLTILDAPPGTSCPLVETLRGVDYCLLVTEPTPFGLHDLRLATEVTRIMGVRAAVVLNRAGLGNREPVAEYAAAAGLPLLLDIPFARRTAAILAQGGTLLDTGAEWRERLLQLWNEVHGLIERTPEDDLVARTMISGGPRRSVESP